MSEVMDRGSWLFAAIAVVFISMAFFVTIDAKLYEAYAIPNASQYLHSVDEIDEDSPEAQAAYDKAMAAYQQAMNDRPRIPIVGDRLFQFFSFEPTRFYE